MSNEFTNKSGSRQPESLCTTCVSGHVVSGYQETHQITICHLPSEPLVIRFPVRLCTDYRDRRKPSLNDMKEVAHVLVRGQRGKQVGFVTPDQYREMETENDD